MVVLSTVEQAFEHLCILRADPDNADAEVKFSGELAKIRLYFEGPGFHQSVPGELAIGLASYQEEIFRAARYALYGANTKTQLTAEQRKAFELVFNVEEGSSEIWALAEKIAEGLSTGIAAMDPVTLAVVVILVVLILTTGVVAWKMHEAVQPKKLAEAVADGNAKVAAQQVELAKVLTDTKIPAVKHFESAQDAGIKEVLRSVPQATNASVNGVSFDADDIRELRRRSPRAKAEHLSVTEVFKVYADTNQTPVRLTLSCASLPGEFAADFPEDLSPEGESALWEAIKKKGTLMLEVDATLIREKVRSAAVLDVILNTDA